MLLTAESFDAIARLLGPRTAPATGGGGQRRREPRLPIRGRLTILPCPMGLGRPAAEPLSVPVRDLSRGGMRFVLPRRLPLDTEFVLFLPQPSIAVGSSAAPVAVHCAVTWWQPLARDRFALGARFLDVLQNAAMPQVPARTVLPEIDAEPQRVAG